MKKFNVKIEVEYDVWAEDIEHAKEIAYGMVTDNDEAEYTVKEIE